LAGEASEAAAGDVDGRLVRGHAEEFVQFTGSERLAGVLVEGVQVTMPSRWSSSSITGSRSTRCCSMVRAASVTY